jgi:hypothetical protein
MPMEYETTVSIDDSEIIDFVNENLDPEDCFSDTRLSDWAQDNSFVHESDIDEWCLEHDYVKKDMILDEFTQAQLAEKLFKDKPEHIMDLFGVVFSQLSFFNDNAEAVTIIRFTRKRVVDNPVSMCTETSTSTEIK